MNTAEENSRSLEPLATVVTAVPAGDERGIMVDEGQNAVVVEATGNRWVSLCHHEVDIVREASGEPLAVFIVKPGSYTVRTDGALSSVSVEHREVPRSALELVRGGPRATLRIFSDAPDVHVVDGVGEIPADGVTAATVTVQKVDAAGAQLADGDDDIFLRCTGGVLMEANTDTKVRSVRLRDGRATFQLVSDNSPKLVTVFAFSADRLLGAELPMEFI